MVKLYKPDFLFDGTRFQRGRAIAVKDGVILEIGRFDALLQNYPEALLLDWSGLAMVPGTVNVHNHSFQSLLRGIAADRPFLEWRDQSLYRYSPKMTLDDTYCGALFAFSEMLKCGVTTVSDFFYLHNFGLESDEAVIRAARDAGIRLVLARTMYDWDGAPAGYVETVETACANTRALAKKYNGSGMTTVLPAPHSLHAASPEMVVQGHRLAQELDTCFHIHVAEEPFEVEQVQKEHNGLHPVEYLDSLGVVDDRTVMVHGVWLKEEETQRYGECGGKLAYCPSSNMFLADGITDIPLMRKSGVLIGLGSDGACSNNRVSIFEEMRMVSLLQKAKTCDAMCLDYAQAFAMGTRDGAELLGLHTGRLEAGYAADFTGIDLEDLSMQPVGENLEQLLPNIVYSMQPTAIKEVVVNGENCVADGRLTHVKEETVAALVRETMRRLAEEGEKGAF